MRVEIELTITLEADNPEQAEKTLEELLDRLYTKKEIYDFDTPIKTTVLES